MSAGNAFALQAQGVKQEKAPRLEDGVALRHCNAETGLEVDVLILDFLVCQAQTVCLQSRQVSQAPGFASSSGVDTRVTTEGLSLKHNILLVDWFRKFFYVQHPTFRPDRELRFRSDLLQLTALFTQRLSRNPMTPSRDELRRLQQHNQDRARTWIAVADRVPTLSWEAAAEIYDKQLPLPAQELERNRAQILHALGLPAEDEMHEPAFVGTPDCVSLLDLLPLFMRISALRNAMADSVVSPSWLALAAQFMLQACLEQFLVFGASGTDAIDEAFAWGYKHEDNNNEDNDATDLAAMTRTSQDPAVMVNDMFSDPELATEIDAWQDLKADALAQLFPRTASDEPLSSSVLPHLLQQVAARHPFRAFEAAVFDFLAALHGSLERPVLLQETSRRF
nr:hypothetical protein CFP56_38903 [Quercus suber]